MIVDDVDHDNPVRLAVEDALKHQRLADLGANFFFPTFRGAWIARKKEA